MTSTISPPADTGGPLILKTDILGRVRMPAERREALLAEFDKSGLSGAKFAALSGVKYQTFANWVQRRRRKQSQPERATHQRGHKPEAISWLEAVVQEAGAPDPASSGSLCLQLPGGVRVQVGSAREVVLAAALVRALEKGC